MGGAHFSQHHLLVGGVQTDFAQWGAQALKGVRGDYEGRTGHLVHATLARNVRRRQRHAHLRAGALVHLHLAHQHGGLPAHGRLRPASAIRGTPERCSSGLCLRVRLSVSARALHLARHRGRDHCDGHRHDVVALCKCILGECAPCSCGHLAALGRLHPARHRPGLRAHGTVGTHVRWRAYMRVCPALRSRPGAYRRAA